MNGTVKLESIEGKGSTFSFTIPNEISEQILTNNIKRHEFADISKHKILLVDDNEINRMSAQKILENSDCVINTAQNAFEAFHYIALRPYDLILMDLSMPILNGIETTKVIKKSYPIYKKIPIVALTATTDQRKIDSCYKAGMIDYLVKPYTKSDLCRAIEKHPIIFDEADFSREYIQSEQITNLIEDFGHEYAVNFIGKCKEEANRLIQALEAGYVTQDFNLIGQSAHDLSSIVGQMGMLETLNLSQQIEKASDVEKINKINKIAINFFHNFYRELPRIE